MEFEVGDKVLVRGHNCLVPGAVRARNEFLGARQVLSYWVQFSEETLEVLRGAHIFYALPEDLILATDLIDLERIVYGV